MLLNRGGSRLLLNNGLTNLVSFPQALDNAYWLPFEATVTPDAAVAPDGTTTADKVTPTVNNLGHGIQANGGGSVHGTGINTDGVFAKYAGYPRIAFRGFDGTAYRIRTTFDIQVGTVVLDEAGVGRVVNCGNGWFFCYTVGASFLAAGGFAIDVLNSTSTAQGAFAGDGTSGVYLWQAEAVAGSSPGPAVFRG